MVTVTMAIRKTFVGTMISGATIAGTVTDITVRASATTTMADPPTMSRRRAITVMAVTATMVIVGVAV